MKFKKLIKITIPALFFCVVFSVSAFCASSFTIPFRPIGTSPLAIGSYYLVNRPGYTGNLGTDIFANAVYNYSVPSSLSPVMSNPIALEYRSDIVIGSPYGGYPGYFVFDTYDVRNAPSQLENSVYYGIDVVGYNSEPNGMTAGQSIFNGGYYSFNLNIGCSFDEDFSLSNFSNIVCVPVFGIYNKNYDPQTSNPPLYFIYGDGAVRGTWLGDDNGFWDNDSSFYFDNFSFDFVLDGASCLTSLSSLIDLSTYGDVFFAGFRFAICSDVFDYNEKPFIAFPNLVGGARLSAEEYANILTKQQIEQANKNTEEVIGAINSPIDNTPIDDVHGQEEDIITDFGGGGGSFSGAISEGQSALSFFSSDTAISSALVLLGGIIGIIFTNSYWYLVLVIIMLVILVGIVINNRLGSSVASSIYARRDRHARNAPGWVKSYWNKHGRK